MALVRKLVAVLETIEKLPVYSYDTASSGYGLQVGAVTLLVVFGIQYLRNNYKIS